MSTEGILSGSEEGLVVKSNRKLLSSKKWILGAVFASTVILGVVVYMVFIYKPNPIPASIREAASFTVYYPGQLPSGISVDKSSISYGQGVLIYKFTSNNSSSLVVSQQVKPENFDFESIEHERYITNNYGIADIKERPDGSQSISFVTKDNTWVVGNANKDFPPKDLEIIFGNMKPI